MAGEQPSTPVLVGIGAVFIDDIVLPTGQTYMGQLGGGVVHALMGAAMWGGRPGINAVVGQGLPDEALSRLEHHLDTEGLIRLDIPQIRAWQLFEEDGTRRELYRVADVAPFILGAQPGQLPDAYHTSKGFYLLQGFEGIRAWCAEVQGCVLWEPLQQIMTPDNHDHLRAVLHDCPISLVSPNLAEAEAIYGAMPAHELAKQFLDDGAQAVALRMGERGSLVARRDEGKWWLIPAVAVQQVVDQTGAGNTYCGGLLWGLVHDFNLAEAGAMGAVSASYSIETVGVINPAHVDHMERDRRYQGCLADIKSH